MASMLRIFMVAEKMAFVIACVSNCMRYQPSKIYRSMKIVHNVLIEFHKRI